MENILRSLQFREIKLRLWNSFCILGLFIFTAGLLLFPNEVKSGTADSIMYCLTVLTPSLFPFMALTNFAVASGAAELLGRPLGFIARYLFRLPAVCTVSVLLSFVGGYPSGARAAALLLEERKISPEQAGRMLLFCVNPGIAFVVTFLGGGILGSFRLGWLLFFSVTISGLLLGFISGLGAKISAKEHSGRSARKNGGALIRSVTDASSAVMKMCACVVLFSGINVILHGSGIFQTLSRFIARLGLFTQTETAALLSFIIEVTGGAGSAAELNVAPAFYAFGAAFGGLCVHLQVFSFFNELPVKKAKFFLFRFLHGALAAGCFTLLQRLFPAQIQAELIAASAKPVAAFSGTLAGGLSLFLMCAAFLLITSQNSQRDCNNPQNVIKLRK